MSTARLPLRIDPRPGEAWLGYTQRVAAAYATSWATLLGEVVPGGPRACRYPLTPRMRGLAASPSTVTTMARFFNLTEVEVRRMQLMTYQGSAVSWGTEDILGLDPLDRSRTGASAAGWAGPLLVSTREVHRCSRCYNDSPGWLALSWQLRVHLICTRHRRLITPDRDHDTNVTITDEHIAAQDLVLDRLANHPDNRRFFTDLAEILQRLRREERDRWWDSDLATDPAATLERFSSGVRRANAPGYPHYQGLATWPNSLALKHLVAPQPQRRPVSPGYFPHLLPMDLYLTGLADLCYPTPITLGRAASSMAAQMTLSGASAIECSRRLPESRRHAICRALISLLVQLEQQGRLEGFWDLARAAGDAIAEAHVDYPAREALCRQESTRSVATDAEPRAHARIVRTWLASQWACTFSATGAEQPSVRDRTIEDFDREYGAPMRAALQRWLESTAA